jgi:hypothetical protein
MASHGLVLTYTAAICHHSTLCYAISGTLLTYLWWSAGPAGAFAGRHLSPLTSLASTRAPFWGRLNSACNQLFLSPIHTLVRYVKKCPPSCGVPSASGFGTD